MKKFFFLLFCLSCGAVMASEVPNVGVDVSGYISAAISALGVIVGVAVGGYGCFLIIKEALGYVREYLECRASARAYQAELDAQFQKDMLEDFQAAERAISSKKD